MSVDEERLEDYYWEDLLNESDEQDYYGPEEDHETEERTDCDPDDKPEAYSEDDLMGSESEHPLEEALSLEQYEEDRKIDNLIDQCEPPEGDIDYPF